MEKLKRYAKENFIPIIRDETLKFLLETCKNASPKRILEIGTAIGYSGILLLKNSDAQLVTIEKNEQRAAEALDNFKKYEVLSRVELKLGDALEEIEKLKINSEKFDFIFLDGPKGQYFRYYPLLKELLSGGGTMFVDNVDLLGLIDSPEKVTHKNRAMFNNMKKFISMVENDSEIEKKFYHIDDGFCIIRKNNK